jgi:putative FmdB family regulatory protein
MPIYEYVCDDCDARFEKLVRRFGEAVSCPSCLSATVAKQLSSFAVSTTSKSAANVEGCGRESGGCGAPACGGGACGLTN